MTGKVPFRGHTGRITRVVLAVAQQLGAFLSAIHSFPVDLARQLQLDEQNPNDFWGRIAYPARDFKAFEYYGELRNVIQNPARFSSSK